jgi:hypothetical protein
LASRLGQRRIGEVEEAERRRPGTASTHAEPEQEIRKAHPERTCPNCGAPLIERKCKLLCPNQECGYYMSCSDFY